MRKAFTLIELLIVIAIIGILAGILFVSIGQNPLIKSRDAKRVSDMQNMRTALTLYYTDNNAYPVYNGDMSVAGNALSTALVSAYVPALPRDPGGSACDTTFRGTTTTKYWYEGNATGYVLQTCLENGNQVLAADCDNTGAAPACIDDLDSVSGTTGGEFDIHS